MTEDLVIKEEGALANVQISRPPGNLFTVEMCERLTTLLTSPPEGAHIMRLSGSGGVFCRGRERPAESVEDLHAEVRALVALNEALVNTSLVTIAEVAGDAAGFGAGLAALCDVALISTDAQLSFPEVTIDLAPSLVLAWLTPMVGRRAAFWLTASGQAISGEEARAIGLVNQSVPAPDLTASVDEVVAGLLRYKPRVHREIKDMLKTFATLDADQANMFARDRLVLGSLARRRT